MDSYADLADYLLTSGRIPEAFEIYNYIYLCGHLSLSRFKKLSRSFIDYVLRLSNDGVKVEPNIFEGGSLLCQMCSPPDILRCPVTAKCGHTFCKECCDKALKCPVCKVYFDPISNLFEATKSGKMEDSPIQKLTKNTSSSTSTSTTTTTTYTFPTTSLVTSTASQSTSILCHSSSATKSDTIKQKRNNRSSFSPDILVRQIVEKWWSDELILRQMIDLSRHYLNMNVLNEALKLCNESLEKFPDNFQGLLLRAEIFHKSHNYQSSLEDSNKAIQIQALSPNAFFQKAQALAALEKFEEALISLCLVICSDSRMEIFTTTHFERSLLTIVQQLFDNDLTKSNNHNKSFKRRRMSCESSNNFQFDIYMNSRLKKHFRRKNYNKERPISELNDICYIPEVKSEKGLRFANILSKTKEEIRKLKDKSITTRNNLTKHVNPLFIDPSDFDCVLCCRTLWKPVVTQCGHTYCWVCLTRCLDYSPFCPLCKSSLIPSENSSSKMNQVSIFSKRPTTKFLEVAMQLYIPSIYETRVLQEIDLEPSTPVFVCTTAFPSVPCPLFVYEPRYRLMIRRCIESGDRRFGIVQSQHKTTSKYFDVGTLLEIRDCILLGDGCSILSTVGCKRFKIISKNEKDGYETAKIECIRDGTADINTLAKLTEIHRIVFNKACAWFETLKINLKEEIFRTFGKMPIVEKNWLNSTDGPAWSWWIIAILPLNQQLKVAILATTCLEKRLKAIEKTIDFISGNFRKPGGNCVVLRDISERNPSGLCQTLSNANTLDPVINRIDPVDMIY